MLHEANGAGSLYEASIAVKEALRGRALLFIVDRTDIAVASEADGVLLTESGVPTVVAKKIISQKLVGRIVKSPMAAAQAAADGCSLVLIGGPDGKASIPDDFSSARNSQKSGSSIPLIQHITNQTATPSQIDSHWTSAMDGLSIPFNLLSDATGEPSTSFSPAGPVDSAVLVMSRLQDTVGGPLSPKLRTSSSDKLSIRKLLQSVDREALIAEQRESLSSVLIFLETTTPDMTELQLLRDSIKQLDDLFLVVTVGEFNSGKSSVINALLGKRYLSEGILPTTNEISILKYSESKSAKIEQQSDGLFVQYLPAPLLQELNIVDTPGTNVILQRQQRLTEEYVPRADLVLFVMSADRPFSDSEVKFLEYIRQWKKKIVFVINKVDLLSGQDEIDEVKAFVADNAKRLLKIEAPNIIAVSSRSALKAKIDAMAALGIDSSLDSTTQSIDDESTLLDQPSWATSGFSDFERFIGNFLVSRGGEGTRLKLQTPLYVADALLEASGEVLKSDLESARMELKAVQMIKQQLEKFEAEMERDALAQREALNKILLQLTEKVESFVDTTVQLSNMAAISAYVSGSKKDQAAILEPFEVDMSSGPLGSIKSSVIEHSRWLESNASSQIAYYSKFIGSRTLAGSLIRGSSPDSLSSLSLQSLAPNVSSAALKTVSEFTPSAFSLILEMEIRAAVVGTSGLAVGGPIGGLLFAAQTANGLEDLLFFTIGGLAAYVSILNLPLRRADVKKKVNAILANYNSEVQAQMKTDLDAQMKEMRLQINSLVDPFEASCSEEVSRLERLEAERLSRLEEIRSLQARAANVE